MDTPLLQSCCCSALIAAVLACGATGEEPHGASYWPVDTVPVLDISTEDQASSLALERLVGATRLEDGRILVADAGPPALILFDSSGILIGELGRAGRGPGEYRSLAWLGRCGQARILAWDPARGRIVGIDRSGVALPYASIGRAYVVGCGRNGAIAIVGWPLPDPAGPNPERSSAEILFIADSGATPSVVGRLPLFDAEWFPPRPLDPAPSIAVTQDRLLVGGQDSATVAAFSIQSGQWSSLRLGVSRRQASEEHFNAAVDLFVQAMAPRPMRAEVRRQVLERVKKPALLPPYGSLHADPEGLLWYEVTFPGDSTTELRAVDEAGSEIATLRLPRSLIVLEVGPNFVLGWYEALSGDRHLSLYRFHRRPT